MAPAYDLSFRHCPPSQLRGVIDRPDAPTCSRIRQATGGRNRRCFKGRSRIPENSGTVIDRPSESKWDMIGSVHRAGEARYLRQVLRLGAGDRFCRPMDRDSIPMRDPRSPARSTSSCVKVPALRPRSLLPDIRGGAFVAPDRDHGETGRRSAAGTKSTIAPSTLGIPTPALGSSSLLRSSKGKSTLVLRQAAENENSRPSRPASRAETIGGAKIRQSGRPPGDAVSGSSGKPSSNRDPRFTAAR